MNIYAPKNKAHYESEKEAIHLILTGIGDEIYSTVDACKIAQEMWEAIKRLQQGESLNIQDVKTNLFWEFGEFTSHDGETMESYYTRFYKLMNKLIRNNLTVATINKNVDTTLRYKNDNQSGYLGSQRTMNVARARKNTDEEIDEQELEAHYSYMAKIQEVPTTDSSTDYEPLEQVKNDTGYNVFSNELQHFEQSESINNTCVVETNDSNVIPDLPDMCDNDLQND
nr:hypothetical protein [Tanacetum cinerariifolium]